MEGKPMETWKPIKGYEGYYAISNYGNVVSVMFRNNRLNKPKLTTVKPTDNGHGYLIVGLNLNGNRKNYYLHRLVAEHFVDNPKGLLYVNHKDYDTNNNLFTNLEWCTQKENVQYSVERMKKPKSKCKPTNTGEKYIRYTGNSYRVNYKTISKNLGSLEEAIRFRNEVVEW